MVKTYGMSLGSILARGMSRGIGMRPTGAFRRPKIFRKFKTYKKKMFNRKRRFQSKQMKKYEIKYSNIIEALNSNCLPIDSDLTTPVTLVPMITGAWPNAGTGKHQMIGSKIYIRKLVVRYTVKSNTTDWQNAPSVVNIIKSKTLSAGLGHKNVYAVEGLTYPNLTTTPDFYDKTDLKQGSGKIIYSKKINPKEQNSLQTGWNAPISMRTRTFKKVIKINKPYEKAPLSNRNVFNFAEYYFDIVKPIAAYCSGVGAQCSLNYYFTFTDI